MSVESAPSDTLAKLVEAAQRTGRDSFRIKVLKRTNGPFPKAIATLDDATAAQVQHAQLWLPLLAGGGQYQLQICHCEDMATPIGGFIAVEVEGQSRQVNPNLNSDPEWQAIGGPRLVSPRPPTAQPPLMSVADMGGATGSSPAARTDGQGSDPARPPLVAQQSSSIFAAQELAFAASQRERASQELDRLRDRERQDAEARHRSEMELEHKRQEAELARAKSEMAAEMAKALASQPKPEASGSGFAAIATALAPVLTALMEGSRHTQLKLAEMQQAQNERMTQMMQEQAKESREVFKALLAPKPPDPMIERLVAQNDRLMEKQTTAGADAAKMIAGMAEAAGATMNMAVGMVQQMRDVMQPPPDDDPTIVKILDRVGAFVAMPQQAVAVAPQVVPQAAPAPRPRPVPVQSPPPPQGPTPSPTMFEHIANRIRSRDPATAVAKLFIDNLSDPSVSAAIANANGQPFVAFSQLLMAGGWLNDQQNQIYVRTVIDEVQKLGLVLTPTQAPPAAESEPVEEAEEEEEDETEGAEALS